MAIPTPSQFEALRIDGNAGVCEVLQKYVQMVNLVADLSAGMFNPDGTLSTEFTNLICATGCGGGGTATSTTGSTGGSSAYVASRYLDGAVFKGRLFYMNIPGFTYSTISGSMNEVIIGMSVRPTDGAVFVLYIDQTSDTNPYPVRLGTVSVSTGVVTPIAVVSSSGSPWSDSGPNDRYSMEFSSAGTLYLSTWATASPPSLYGYIYTVNTATAEAAMLGTGPLVMNSGATAFAPFSLAFDAGGTMYALGYNGDYTLCSVDLVPYAPFGNVLVATEQCAVLAGAPIPSVNNTIWNGLICKGGNKYIWATGTGDIYKKVNGSTCVSTVEFTAPASMNGITAVAGTPS